MNAANDMNVLADRLTRAYEQNDTDAIAGCYAPDARIWHNVDGCMTVTVRDGRIARLDEYLDSAHLKPLQTA
jgi:ketosteroid isomerase-like protein